MDSMRQKVTKRVHWILLNKKKNVGKRDASGDFYFVLVTLCTCSIHYWVSLIYNDLSPITRMIKCATTFLIYKMAVISPWNPTFHWVAVAHIVFADSRVKKTF